MKSTIVIHLVLAAISEALIILIAHGMSHHLIKIWEWQNPGETVYSGATNALLFTKAALVIPFIMVVLAVVALVGRLSSPKATIHCLGISLLLTSFVSLNCVAKSFSLYLVTITEMGSPPLEVQAEEGFSKDNSSERDAPKEEGE